jgi:hypothetical protein
MDSEGMILESSILVSLSLIFSYGRMEERRKRKCSLSCFDKVLQALPLHAPLQASDFCPDAVLKDLVFSGFPVDLFNPLSYIFIASIYWLSKGPERPSFPVYGLG